MVCSSQSGPYSSRRTFDQEALREFRSDPAFDYTKEYAQSDSLASMILYYVMDKILRILGFKGVGVLSIWVLRIAFISVLIALVFYLFRHRYGPLFTSNHPGLKGGSGAAISTEVNEDYEALMRQCLQKKEYKLAIRYQFLKVLTDLGHQGVVTLKQWKAPYEYVTELPEAKRPYFIQLTNLFEETWYGDYQADEVGFRKGEDLVTNLL